MIFNSMEYALFLPVVFVAYWLLKSRLKWQNALLLVASYVFYGSWDWRFLSLIIVSTLVDYFIGRALPRTQDERRRKRLLVMSLGANLGILAFFKYFDFFIDSASAFLTTFGLEPNPPLLEVLLPVGISFYTFQTISYTFDIYRRRLEPTDNLLTFAVYVAFFPQLVAGPIERAKRLLPQLASPRSVDLAWIRSGLGLILLGLFKKVVIADVMAGIVNEAYAGAATAGAPTLWMGVFAFSLQIYGDFSGYTDMARGSSRLFGIELMENFKQPYLSRNITEFWRTWHVSLSDWLRDYLYIPLGGNRNGRWQTYRNLLITMLLGGLWHGAAWGFVIWGGLHGLYLAIHRRYREKVPREPEPWRWRDSGITVVTFFLVSLTWIPFRAEGFTHAYDYIRGLLGRTGEIQESFLVLLVPALIATFAIDLIQRNSGRELFFFWWRPAWRGVAYATLVIPIVIFSGGQTVPFIYFQF